MMNNAGVKQVKEELQNTADDLNASVATTEQTQKPINEQTTGTANGYKEKAGEYAKQGLNKVSEIKDQVFEIAASSTDYVKNYDFEETKHQLRTTVKKQPELSLAIAGLVGLVIGLIISRRKN